MGVVSTFVVDDYPQADGRVRVVETHVLPDGTSEEIPYLLPVDGNPDTILQQHKAAIEARLSEENLGG